MGSPSREGGGGGLLLSEPLKSKSLSLLCDKWKKQGCVCITMGQIVPCLPTKKLVVLW